MSSKCSSFGSVVKLPQGHHNFVVVFLHGWLGQKVRTMNPSMEEVALESALARESYRFRLDVIKLCQTHSIAAKYCSFPVVYDFIPRSYVSNFVDKHKITQVNTRWIPVCGPLSLLSSQYFKDLHVLSAAKEHLEHKQQLNMPTMSNMMWALGRLEGCLQGSREGETGLFWKIFGQAVQAHPRIPGEIFMDMHSWQSMSINLCPKLK